MNHWTNIRTWKRERFTVTLDWTWEAFPDLSWDDDGEVSAKLESGEWGNFTFRVRVTLDGREVGADYLGNATYADPEEFYLEHIGIRAKAETDGRTHICCFSDMIATACREARANLCATPRMRCA